MDPPHAVILDIDQIVDLSQHPGVIETTPGRGGTVGYIASKTERVGSFISYPADVFSLGCVALQLANVTYATRTPWPAFNLWRTLTTFAPRRSLTGSQIATELQTHKKLTGTLARSGSEPDNLIGQMLHLDPEARPTLEKVLEGSGSYQAAKSSDARSSKRQRT
ncbi:hypothetical protein K431DRAFT_307557 [Polychaeton citri CBS 116435]|uniref:Protein kinase domain-containing protein n=1 Tax=Polychaeton citri CBS 116435 TaxID=1314669 RepID=A0A9P4UL95_9PEZI|nr:hypothetical protein K431DRAFT_307557 [Polychaeton citri CBS 116435]